jgi:hypothetical protein
MASSPIQRQSAPFPLTCAPKHAPLAPLSLRAPKLGSARSQSARKICHVPNEKETRKLYEGNKSSNQRISLNRSQYGGCSTGYNTLTSNQVVCKWSCAPTLNRSGPALATPPPFSCGARPYARALAATLPPHRVASRHRGAELSLPWLGGILT